MHMRTSPSLLPLALLLLAACEKPAEQALITPPPPVTLEQTGSLASARINEASGMQASFSNTGDFFVHNDEGKPLIYVIGQDGSDLGRLVLVPAKNNDWEDLASVPVDTGRWIVIGAIGDNMAKRKYITLYFAAEPQAGDEGRYDGMLELKHRLDLTYPDGPRDCESMAYDPVGEQILLLSKRDRPPRIYAVSLATALAKNQAELKLVGEMTALRSPTIADRARWGGRTDWISQPTGFDIAADGSEAVIVTYRSVYRFRRLDGEDWPGALQRKPEEVVGPPAVQNEAIAYSVDGKSIYVTTEKRPAPVYRLEFSSR